MARIYLDTNATAPLRPEAGEAITQTLAGEYGNPSSVHRPGHRAKLLLESARRDCAALLGARPEELVFTSGGTESNNLALHGAMRRHRSGHLIISRIEHSSVLAPADDLERDGFRVTRVPPDEEGWIDPKRVLEAVREDTRLISLMHSNNELGTLQAVQQVARGIRGKGVLFHTDAVQSAGKLPLDVGTLGVDLLSISAHKMGGPPGVGALWIRKGTALVAQIRGGGQEDNRRAGTEALPLLVGFGIAARLAREELTTLPPQLERLRDRLEKEIERHMEGAIFHARRRARLPNTTSVAFPGFGGEELMMALDLEGIAVSTGSACAVGTIRPSHVLEAMGCSLAEAKSTLRISLGRQNTETEVDRFVETLAALLEQGARAKSGVRIPSLAGRSLKAAPTEGLGKT